MTPEDKARYEKAAAEDKMRFQLEMQQYTAAQAVQQQQAYAQAAASQPASVAAAMQQQYHGVQAPTTGAMYMDPNGFYHHI